MGAHVSVNLSQSVFERLVSRVGGPGARMLQRRAEQVANLARAYSQGHGSIPAGIVVGPYRDKSIQVISTNPHSLYVLNGTRPHQIRPRRARGVLRFEVGGRVVFAKVVNHPGYRGDNYMLKALRDAR